MRVAARLSLGLLLCLAARAAFAYRPFDSTDADVASTGDVEIELGPAGILDEGSTRSLIAPQLRLNWGFAPAWEAVLEGSRFVPRDPGADEPHDRIEDTALSFKSVLRRGSLQEGAGPSLATEAGVLLPTAHGEPGTGASAALIGSQRWKAVTLHLNGAAEWTRSHNPALFEGIILEGPGTWAVRPAGEVFAQQERGGNRVRSGLLGVIWRVRENLSFDLAFRDARENSASIHELRAGLTWAFTVRKHP